MLWHYSNALSHQVTSAETKGAGKPGVGIVALPRADVPLPLQEHPVGVRQRFLGGLGGGSEMLVAVEGRFRGMPICCMVSLVVSC